MAQSFTEFLNQYNNVANVGDTPENIGQCVGLVEKWIDNLGLPHVWGNAIDLLNNADAAYYVKVPNTPTNAPSEGDIVIFGVPYGQYADSAGIVRYNGHTGLATKNCTDAVLELFEANDPDGSAPHVKTYNYSGSLGWLHPKTLPNTVNQEVSPTVDQVQQALQNQISATTTCQTQLKAATDQCTTLQGQLLDESNKVMELTKKLSDLQSSYETEQNRNIALNQANATISAENQDKATQLLDAQHLLAQTRNYFYAIVDKIGIKRINLSDDDITEKSLAEIEASDHVIKAQDAKITELQQMPAKATGIIIAKSKSALQTVIGWFFTSDA